MNQSTIAVTLVRLFAVGLIIYAFRNAGMAFFFIAGGHTSMSHMYMLFTGIAVPVIAAGFMWLAPGKIVGSAVSYDSKYISGTFDAQRSFSVGVALIGIYLVVTALASIFDWLITYNQHKRMMGEMLYTPSSSYAELFADIFVVVVGLLLFLGSSGLARVFISLKSYGTDVHESPEEGSNQTEESSGSAEPGNRTGDAG